MDRLPRMHTVADRIKGYCLGLLFQHNELCQAVEPTENSGGYLNFQDTNYNSTEQNLPLAPYSTTHDT